MFRERRYIFDTPYFAATLVWHRDQICQPNSQSGGVIIFHCRSRHWCDLLIELCSLYVLFCQSSSSLAYFGEKKKYRNKRVGETDIRRTGLGGHAMQANNENHRVKNESKKECCENMLYVSTWTAEGVVLVGLRPTTFLLIIIF